MKNLTKTTLVAVAAAVISCAIFSQQAQAVPITGDIQFQGLATTDTGNLGTATAFTSFSSVTVSTLNPPTGDYTGTAGQSVTMNGFVFNPPGGVSPLWTFTNGGPTYSFDLATAHVSTQNSTFLNVVGSGIANISGFDPTSGTFSTTLTGSGMHTSFLFTSDTPVPDGGSAVALLGVGLAGIEVLRRKLRAA